MSEVDVNGQVLSTFTDVRDPGHLSTDSEGHVFVSDCWNDRILLLSSQLHLGCILINSQVKQQKPWRLFYNELTSQLHVTHGEFLYPITIYWPIRWLHIVFYQQRSESVGKYNIDYYYYYYYYYYY